VAPARSLPAGDVGEFARGDRRGATAGSGGAFELDDPGPGAVTLLATGDGIVPARFELGSGADRDAVEVRVLRPRELSLHASRGRPLPDSIRALDAADRTAPLWGGGSAASLRL